MSGTRAAVVLGAVPIIVAIIYVVWPAASEEAAGFVLLLALGLSMGFGMLVILRGARDL
jgi:predicted phage tail protein